MTAAHDWLDLRVPFDDAARQHSLSLLNQVASALRSRTPGGPQPVTIIDIGAGTGNSAHWFRQHLPDRLPGQPLRWVLVDTDQAALDTAVATLPGVETVTANISQLPSIANDLLALAPDRLLVTGSAVLDVLTTRDLQAIIDTLAQHGGLGLFLLSITGQWQLTPADCDDEKINDAFCGHQRRDGKLGPIASETLYQLAVEAETEVTTAPATWQLTAPQDHDFIARFLTERTAAAVEYQPQLHTIATRWLHRRLQHCAEGLTVEVDHLDVAVDARRSAKDAG